MGNKSKPGQHYYKKLGLEPMVLHLNPKLKNQLKTIAKKEERSLQITVRRILEEHIKSRGK